MEHVEIRDQFVVTKDISCSLVVTCESVKSRLLRENNLTLEKLQDIARREEGKIKRQPNNKQEKLKTQWSQ